MPRGRFRITDATTRNHGRYLIAAVGSTALITWYCNFFLGGGVRTFMIGAGLAGIYTFLYINTFLYITLRQQDYALLMGAIALFIVLTIVMYVTRKVDWYARDAVQDSEGLQASERA